MSAIENFITGKSKSLYYWWKLIIENFNIEKTTQDNSWKSIKLKSSHIPDCWDVNNPLGSVAKSYELQFKTFKRYGTN
jgi:hypothetical protein